MSWYALETEFRYDCPICDTEVVVGVSIAASSGPGHPQDDEPEYEENATITEPCRCGQLAKEHEERALETAWEEWEEKYTVCGGCRRPARYCYCP